VSVKPARSVAMTVGIIVGIVVASVAAWMLLFGVLLRFRPWRIPQGGMAPTFAAGARLWADKRAYRAAADVRRGDVVIFQQEIDGVTYDFIWRIVGLPGETISIRDDAVLVDGRPLPRRVIERDADAATIEECAGQKCYRLRVGAGRGDPAEIAPDMGPVRVPAGHFFCLGDNRHDAADCRVHGAIPFQRIIARAIE
jgi:signal peptidase I